MLDTKVGHCVGHSWILNVDNKAGHWTSTFMSDIKVGLCSWTLELSWTLKLDNGGGHLPGISRLYSFAFYHCYSVFILSLVHFHCTCKPLSNPCTSPTFHSRARRNSLPLNRTFVPRSLTCFLPSSPPLKQRGDLCSRIAS
jgi:hypothetical protein